MPRLLTRISTVPTLLVSSSTPCFVPRSAATPAISAFLADWRIFFTAASTRSCERPLTTTAAPSSAKSEAMAKPIPAVEPVTRAFRFLSCKSIGTSFRGSSVRDDVSGLSFHNHFLQRLLVLQAGQHSFADNEHRDAGDTCFVVGVPQCLLVCFSILPSLQRLLEPLRVQPDLTRQFRQYGDVAAVLALHKKRLQDPM